MILTPGVMSNKAALSFQPTEGNPSIYISLQSYTSTYRVQLYTAKYFPIKESTIHTSNAAGNRKMLYTNAVLQQRTAATGS